jgi:hypothetical protein
MQRILLTIGQVFVKRILIVGLISLLSLSSLFMFSNQPALADKGLSPDEKIDRAYNYGEAAGIREEDRQAAYDATAQAVQENPKEAIEKIYEEDLKEFKEENPGENGLLEGAKELVEKVTGQD